MHSAAPGRQTLRGITPALLGTLALLAALGPFAIDLYLPAFPEMVTDLDTSATLVQLTLTAFLLGLAVGQLLFGPLSDRFGRVKPLIAGSTLCVVASAVTVIAPSIEILIGARFVQGFSGAAGMVIGRAIVADLATGKAAARAFSLLMIVGGVAPVLAPVAGGFLVGPLGWRGALAAILVLSVLMLVAVLAVIRETHTAQRRAELHERRLTEGSPLRELGSRGYLGHSLALCLSFAALMAYISASPFVYQSMIGLSPAQYGAAFGANALGLVAVSALSARLTMRHEVRRLAGIGLATLWMSALTFLTLALSGVSPAWLAVPMLTLVAGMGLIFGNTTALALGAAPRAAGTASAVLGAAQFLLAAAVTPLVGLYGEHTAVPAGIVMLGSATLAALGFGIAKPARTPHPRREDPRMSTTSTATVATPRAGRYGKQLVSHLGRHSVGHWDDETGSGTLDMKGKDGTGPAAHITFTSSPDALHIEVRTEPEHLAMYEDVVGRHLVKFGAKDELTVDWHRAG